MDVAATDEMLQKQLDTLFVSLTASPLPSLFASRLEAGLGVRTAAAVDLHRCRCMDSCCVHFGQSQVLGRGLTVKGRQVF